MLKKLFSILVLAVLLSACASATIERGASRQAVTAAPGTVQIAPTPAPPLAPVYSWLFF